MSRLNLLVDNIELIHNISVNHRGMEAIHKQRHKKLNESDGQINYWHVAKFKKVKSKNNKISKIEIDKKLVIKYKVLLKTEPKKRGAKFKRELQKENDVLARTGLTVDAEELEVTVEKVSAAIARSSLGSEASGDHLKEAQPNAATLGKLPLARARRSSLPSGGDSTKRSKISCVSTPKLTGTHSEAIGSNLKQEEKLIRRRCCY